ncbi:MAG: NAD(P)/FAD-dependent oxidoreductase [Aureispira sp.]|nr:NAD(P)/FAD-dependent oxidoreductase [Aureispira sp.]
MNIPKLGLPRVVIIGGGFAGLKLAKTIDSRQYQVVLFDKNNYHTFQPLMYQVATAGLEPDSIAYPIRKVFKNKKNFHFRMASVEQIDDQAQTIHTSIGSLQYDYLVMATGANSNFFGMKNVERYSVPMKNLVESLDLRSIILQNFEKALNTSDIKEQESLMNFVIVGAGATGVELAGALAELKHHILPKDYPDLDIRRMQIHIIEAAPKVLANMSEQASSKSLKFLKKLGINIWVNTQVKDYDGYTVSTNHQDFHAHTLIWAAGVKGQPVAGLKTPLVRGNRVEVDEFCAVKGYDNVYALGDVAAIINENTPKGHAMLASVAAQQGAYLGKIFNKKAKNKQLKPFVYKDKGTMATIGRNLAVVDLPKFKFSGFFAWMAWMFVHLMLLVDFRSRMVVFINWAWSYVNYDKSIRLIIRKPLKSAPKKDELIDELKLPIPDKEKELA